MEALGKRLNYESISCLYGNSFAKDASKIVQASYPLAKNGAKSGGSVMDLPGAITVIEKKTAAEKKKAAEKELGDLSWAEGLF